MPDKSEPAPPIAVSDSAAKDPAAKKNKPLEPAQPPVDDPGEEAAAGGLDVPTGD